MSWINLTGLRQGPLVHVEAIIGKAIEQGEEGVLWLLSSLSLKSQYSTRVEPNICLAWHDGLEFSFVFNRIEFLACPVAIK